MKILKRILIGYGLLLLARIPLGILFAAFH